MAAEDFEKLVWESLEKIKKQVTDVGARVGKVEQEMKGITNFLFDQARVKASKCTRVSSFSGKFYCSAFPYKSVVNPSGFVFVGNRYYAIPGGYQCFVCAEFEAKEKK